MMQLLLLRSQDLPCMPAWLKKTTNFTSPEIQNEILTMLSHGTIRHIVTEIKASARYSIVVDGTQDCSGMEQEAICIRYVNTSFEIVEAFVGLFNPTPDTTGVTLSIIVKDVLTRFNLPLENLRAQTYDGVGTMSGIYSGCQALIARDNPIIALYFHCSAHCANLVAEHTANACPLVRDALQSASDVGVLYKRSGKFKDIFDIGSANFYETPTTRDVGRGC